jgi:glycosyltransferase involved in cell wall biosynthesis
VGPESSGLTRSAPDLVPAPGPASPLPSGPAVGADTVTAIVVAKNEERRIEACLRSLLWADRILVIDNGSSDRTAEVAARYTRWIVWHELPPEIDPVHGNLNYGFGLITEGWILQVDADERASVGLSREIRERCPGAAQNGFWIPFRIGILGRWIHRGYWGTEGSQIRLFRAGRGAYSLRSLHENVEVSGAIGRMRAPIYHLPFQTVSEFITKTNRYTDREVDLILHGDSPGISSFGRKAAHPSGFRLIWSGVRLFLWSLFRLGGWREGKIGLATSAMLGVYGFLEVLKVWEKAEGLTGDIELPEDDHV